MSQEKTKVYIYTRVSTTMQIDGYSLDAQKARMKAYGFTFGQRKSCRVCELLYQSVIEYSVAAK